MASLTGHVAPFLNSFRFLWSYQGQPLFICSFEVVFRDSCFHFRSQKTQDDLVVYATKSLDNTMVEPKEVGHQRSETKEEKPAVPIMLDDVRSDNLNVLRFDR